jgi:hypothetical protein
MHLDVKRSSSAKITMFDWRKTEITGEEEASLVD